MNTHVLDGPRPAPRLRLLSVILLGSSLLLAGCSGGTYRGKEGFTVIPVLRIQAEVSPGKERDGPGDPGLGGEVRAGYLQTLEAELQTMSGSDSGSFGSNIEVGSTVFPAGTDLDGDFRLTSASAFMTSGYRTETGLEFTTLYGVEFTALDLDVTGGGLHGKNDTKEFGPLFGVRLRWLLDERFRIYASSRIGFLFFSHEQNEVGIEARIVPRVSLFTGYRRSEYNLDDDDDARIDLVWKGLVFGVQLEF